MLIHIATSDNSFNLLIEAWRKTSASFIHHSLSKAMLFKKLPEKLGDPGKFLIPSDPRVPLILWRSFVRTIHALIDVYEGELDLSDENEQITFHVNGTSKHPQKHVNESIKMVNDTCKDSFEKFTDKPALVCLPPSEDVNNEKEKQEVENLAKPTVKHQTRITPCLKNFKVICKESMFHSNKPPQVSSVFAITSTLPSIEPKDSLIIGDEPLSTFSTEEIIPIPRESEETSRSNSKNILPSCDDFNSINVPRDDSVNFFNPLFEFDVNFNLICADIAKIARKRSKPGKYEHGERKSTKEPGESYQGQIVKLQSNLVKKSNGQLTKRQNPKISKSVPQDNPNCKNSP
ncbi:hypothetical protein Tco_0446884 [Tanacetum coccineum]